MLITFLTGTFSVVNVIYNELTVAERSFDTGIRDISMGLMRDFRESTLPNIYSATFHQHE